MRKCVRVHGYTARVFVRMFAMCVCVEVCICAQVVCVWEKRACLYIYIYILYIYRALLSEGVQIELNQGVRRSQICSDTLPKANFLEPTFTRIRHLHYKHLEYGNTPNWGSDGWIFGADIRL